MLEEEVHRVQRPWKQVANEAIRRGLSSECARAVAGNYRVVPHHAKLRAGVDSVHLNALVDEIDVDGSKACAG